MRLTKKLLDYLHTVFDKAPGAELALRLQYDGDAMTWTVSDGVLTTDVLGGSGAPLEVDLRGYNVAQLANFFAAQQGYSVEYLNQDHLDTGARALLDGSGSIGESNGDHLFVHTNVLWSYLEAMAQELQTAADAIVQMLRQMSTRTAEDIWLDELGRYYGVPRLDNEPDGSYGPRIIAEVLRPRGNNIAIALAIQAYTGEVSEVIDVTVYGPQRPLYDGSIVHDGADTYNSTASPVYGFFDVTYGYDLINGGSFTEFESRVRVLVDRVRDAGTHMRALILRAGGMEDTAPMPKEGKLAITYGSSLADSPDADPDDSLVIPQAGMSLAELGAIDSASTSSDVSYTFDYQHNAVRRYDGKIVYGGGLVYPHGTLESEFDSGDPDSIGGMEALHEIVNVTLPSPGYF